MTDAERDALLIRLDERTKKIQGDLEDDYHVIYGNGRPGLVERIQRLEDWKALREHHYGTVAAVIGFIVNAAIAVYAVLKK